MKSVFLRLLILIDLLFSNSHKRYFDKFSTKPTFPKPLGPAIMNEFKEFEEIEVNIFSFSL